MLARVPGLPVSNAGEGGGWASQVVAVEELVCVGCGVGHDGLGLAGAEMQVEVTAVVVVCRGRTGLLVVVG
ncbi:uncharacterized protein M6B38_362610 [Iris pallida]|uniref:Uncharacterized protein n=1 Tax=Iris pallida TaxID=29817 RepID=A0AAX6GIP9_IRIPA|nr:uncharacterized protein M6B38_362610 [Iris pallida]